MELIFSKSKTTEKYKVVWQCCIYCNDIISHHRQRQPPNCHVISYVKNVLNRKKIVRLNRFVNCQIREFTSLFPFHFAAKEQRCELWKLVDGLFEMTNQQQQIQPKPGIVKQVSDIKYRSRTVSLV